MSVGQCAERPLRYRVRLESGEVFHYIHFRQDVDRMYVESSIGLICAKIGGAALQEMNAGGTPAWDGCGKRNRAELRVENV
jgi:hypothetical protein